MLTFGDGKNLREAGKSENRAGNQRFRGGRRNRIDGGRVFECRMQNAKSRMNAAATQRRAKTKAEKV